MSPEPRTFRSMGVDVFVRGATKPELADVRRLFEEWDATFSRFHAGSELNRINADPSPFVLLSRPFAYALREALAAAAQTNGLVDPTLGAALEAAGYDRDFDELSDDPRPPGPPSGGRWQLLRLDRRLLFRPPGTVLDLNGVVKSLAVDAALELIGGGAVVAAGGDIAASGGTDVALPGGESVHLVTGGIATSGSTKRRWRRGGSWQHHLLDPRTGRPAESCWDEVTVAASSCLTADVSAKAAFLLSEDGPGWLDERGLPGRFRVGDDVTLNGAWEDALPLAA